MRDRRHVNHATSSTDDVVFLPAVFVLDDGRLLMLEPSSGRGCDDGMTAFRLYEPTEEEWP